MKKNHIFKVVMVIALCAAILLPFVPLRAEAKAVNNFDISCFEGLQFSLMGDSISTFYGVNNNTFYNTTIGDNLAYYGKTDHDDYANFDHIRWEDTWWQQAIDLLGMELCVNNSWSASYLINNADSDAYKTRPQNLHNTTTEKDPDIVALYMGTNDCKGLTAASDVGTVANAKTMTATSTPSTVLEAYAVMLKKVRAAYPNAEVYCFTLLHHQGYENAGTKAAYQAFNNGIAQLAAANTNCYLVDLYNASGIHDDRVSRDRTMVDYLHPDLEGMDAITNCLVSSMLKNSRYAADVDVSTVTYDLDSACVEVGNVAEGETYFGDVTTAVNGKPFSVKLDTVGISNLTVTVTMGGVDITDTAVNGNSVYISKVTGDIKISATDAFNNYYLLNTDDGFTSNPDQTYEFTHNGVALKSGTHVNGLLAADSTATYKLSQSIVLRHDHPWVMEFEMGGSTYEGGVLTMSNTAASTTPGNTYLHPNQANLVLGYRNREGYCNSGIPWTTIASKLGSTAGADIRKEWLKFKLDNRVNADGSNMVYLTVNGVEIGSMDQVKPNATSELSGIDFVFNYLGTTTHPLRACGLKYVKVYENGVSGIPADEVHNFRWAGVGESMTSAKTDGYFTENALEQEMGSGSNGVNLENSYYSLNKPINLYHDRAWTLEFRAKGTWGAGSQEDPMLLSSCDDSSRLGITYLWRNSGNYIALGTKVAGQAGYQNYGVDMSDLGLMENKYYTYRLENQITTDSSGNYVSNMVWLYIDDVQIGPMTRHRDNNVDTDPVTTDDWISGKDFQFNFLGNKNFPLNGVTFDYIQVWEDGSAVNTLRLRYLLNTAKDDSGNYTNDQGYTTATWTNYTNALKAGQAVLTDVTADQSKVDAAVSNILSTRNALVATASATKIYSVESITGGKAAIGQQCGIKVVTSPNVAQVCVGDQTLIINSSEVQEMLIDGVSTKVKVWMLSWVRGYTTEKSVSYGVGAWTTYDAEHTGYKNDGPDAYKSVTINFSNVYAVDAQVLTQPTKTTYVEGEKFDPTGAKLQITYSDGDVATLTITSETTATLSYKNADGTVNDDTTVSNFSFDDAKLDVSAQAVSIRYDGAAVTIPVTVYGLKITKVPTKMTYAYEEDFDPTGMEVTYVCNDGTSMVVTDYTWYDGNMDSTTGQQRVEVYYQNTTAVLNVTISD